METLAGFPSSLPLQRKNHRFPQKREIVSKLGAPRRTDNCGKGTPQTSTAGVPTVGSYRKASAMAVRVCGKTPPPDYGDFILPPAAMRKTQLLFRDCGNFPCYHKYTRKARKRKETKATNIRNRVSIHERPAEADGKRFGDWEMDLIVDKDNHAILTMIERSTNFLLMSKLKYGKKAMPLAKTVWKLLLPYKGDKLLTITTDNGSEFAEHEWISKYLGGVPVYFTDSYSSWQKGAVENTNKLIRQYIPKGTNINTITDSLITKIQKKINRRPREKLNFSTPVKEFFKHYS